MRWTLISGAVVAMAAGVAIPATRPSQDEMLDKLLKIEDQRLVGDADLDVALNSVDPVIAKQALRVVARFGERRYSDAVRHALQSKDGVVRAEAAFAAGMLRDAGLLGDLNTALAMEDRQAAKRELFVAIGRVGNRDALTALEMAWGKAAETEVKAALARAFGYVFAKAESVDWPVTKESLLALWSAAQSTDIDLARSAGFALSRYRPLGQMTEEEVQAQLNSIKAQDAKSFASRFLGKYATTTNAKWIAKQISNPNEADSVRVELVRTLGRLPINVGRDEGLCLAVDRSPFVAVAALEVIETTANEAMVRCGRAIMALAQRSLSPWIKGQALGALIAVDKAQQYSWFEAGIASRDVMLEKAVYARAGKINDSRIRTIALKALLEKDRQVVVPLLESLQEFPAEWLTVDYKNAVLKLLAKKDFVITSDAYDLAAKFKWQEFVGPAQDTLQETWHEDQYDAILGALRLLAQLGGMQHLSVIEPYLEHPNRFVIEQAVATYKAISGTAPRDVPLNHPKVAAETPSYAETVAAAKKHIVIETNLGAIELEAYGEAPLTYANFVRLAEKGFFNGLNFHRVVSHFVAQGGDPRGDGWGGAGYLIRDEVSPVSHLRGTIGLATAGKDTGSCQLFFNLDPNMNLDANYTLFARVVSGLEIMDRVEVGTKIIRTYTRS